jgi:GT2 family glycosyltransferase
MWEAVGPFDEGFSFYAQDLDLCLRAGRAGWRTELRPELRVLHHHGATIGRAAGASGHRHPELLWMDLLRWARKHRGAAWAARARGALRAGALLRLACRRLALPFLPGSRRSAWREEDRALRAAALAIHPRPL